jgi:hypothetical protein
MLRSTGQRTAFTGLALFALICFCMLGQSVLGSNEAGKLALALQQVEPGWNPNDWYLTRPQSYQWLFQQISGHGLLWFGVGPGALLSRIVGYAAWSWGAAAVCIELGLSLWMSLGAVALFLTHQSLVAGEWMLGGAEPKTLAYAALLLGYVAWRRRHWWAMGFCSGLALSFHILVGFYGAAALALAAVLTDHRTARRAQWLRATAGLILGGLPIGFALAQHQPAGLLSTLEEGGGPSASWIYTYLRNPHHLVPGSWSGEDWSQALLWLGLFAAACWFSRGATGAEAASRRSLATWGALTLVPFALGLGISLWDTNGALLRFYPFRVADSVIPLCTTLLLACQLERSRPRPARLAALIATVVVAVQSHTSWASEASRFHPAPNTAQDAQARAYRWISANTPRTIRILTPPSGFEDLTLLTGRAGVAQFKQIPNRSADIHDWFRRMQALGGDPEFWRQARGFRSRQILNKGFARATPQQLRQLASDYQAGMVLTLGRQAGPQGWRRTYSDSTLSLWQPTDSAAVP